MKTTKTLMLAGLSALSLGVGSAMAQEGGSFSPSGPDFWATQNLARQQNANHSTAQGTRVQREAVTAGSSDRTGGLDDGMRSYNAYNPYVGGN